MQRRHFLALLMALALPAGALAAEGTRLTADQIKVLLAGNTAFGEWEGTAYRQYFSPDGGTVYLPDGGDPDEGKWRVDAGENLYESWWESTGWVAYAIERRDDQLYWVDGEKAHVFTVREGEQLGWQ